MADKKRIIDSHVHLDLIARHHPHRIEWLKENGCGAVSWSYFENSDSLLKLEECLESKASFIRQQSAAGLDCYYLAGVHPRCIPADLKPEQIGSLLTRYMDDPLCRGIGEIGLDTGDSREQEVFIAQLETGRSVDRQGKIIGVHTPRLNKLTITETILKILARFPDISSSIVVDHCTPENISAVLDAGLWAGVSLSPVKTSWSDMKYISSKCSGQIGRIMCNTDSGSKFYEDVVQYSRSRELPGVVSCGLFYGNAARFYRIKGIG